MTGRVLVTGVGAVSCLGSGRAALWHGLLAGGGQPRDVIDPHAHMESALMYLTPEVPAAPVALAHVPLSAGPRFAVAAAREAVDDAGLAGPARAGLPVVLGVEMGNARMHEDRRTGTHRTASSDPDRWTPMTVTAAAVAAALGSRETHTSVGNACAASAYALTVAADMIRAGEADVVLTGGAEGATRVGMGAFNRLGAADPVRCRPFDRGRRGTVFGDGAAMLVLESADHARARGAHAYAEVAGAAWSCDARHPTAPDPSATHVIRAMREALDAAGLGPADVGAVVPHGTGTALNDVVESHAMRAVFGAHCDRLPLINLKAMIGHTAGVAGAFGCATAALALRAGVVPASPRIDEPDPECAVLVPQDGTRPIERPAVMVNSYAFGGNNACVVLTGGAVDR
ncbi:beta-ketoacyl-[acyl-carrier-protein] synthase family protein [Mangrovihabitans endophyticus]|uniref:Ketosynthase family 3 (KS3) domain-containing protein n=1 Tax=Mangrovihabitans endophyticus TaxID=1751298 RepID=A0A8J3BXD1_9ACTN|nr:beta-ketoacyl-[acyl-carrier-protein] synthase family protein [Mangrovihabitans endophyticus]GGK75923.1 hypothetical protein GCM10012284_07410 [Mangrovihabitans endophyticus]